MGVAAVGVGAYPYRSDPAPGVGAAQSQWRLSVDLEAFRVQNYKRIEDTGWVTCRDLTVLVGKNEAGKSAVLRGLSKVKASEGQGYGGLREFPRPRHPDEVGSRDWPAGSGRIRLHD